MDNWEVWKKGIPLEKAHIHFGDREKVEAFNRYRNQTTMMDVITRIEANADRGLEGFDILKGVVNPDAERRKKTDNLNRQLKTEFLQNIKAGLLFAYGFSVPRRADETPQAVPDDLWDVYPYSSGNVLKSKSLKMESIRVLHLNSLRGTDAVPPKTAGRPTRQEHIIEAFETLADQGLIDFSRSASECYELVRLWVLKNYPDPENSDSGLSVKAMEKHVNPMFKRYKSSSL
ncbi:hypothetical protein [Sneathiella sp. HT1-7]|uniref:hypothetical protein n=1 Tax=Sneathiella sp. HT1-7 TaxID=2887192 RepID=UPI001D141F28|nr:hypothetical protein [Sneathiella sp. HT1-7]MCC3305533.1 hypothetical protein [Sneathiella sp. HT1-7]